MYEVAMFFLRKVLYMILIYVFWKMLSIPFTLITFLLNGLFTLFLLNLALSVHISKNEI
jgi:hypothetical protein